MPGRKSKVKRKIQLTKEKAKKILKDGLINGKKLTEKQRGFFGAVAGGMFNRKKKK